MKVKGQLSDVGSVCLWRLVRFGVLIFSVGWKLILQLLQPSFFSCLLAEELKRHIKKPTDCVIDKLIIHLQAAALQSIMQEWLLSDA